MKSNLKILGYGCYIPRFRIKKEEYIKIWGNFQGRIQEKSVIGYDEDTLTMAVEAGKNALKNAKVKREDIKVVTVGSSTPPYALRSMASEVAMAIGIPLDNALLDFNESEKAGTTAFVTAIDILANRGGAGLVIGTDSPLAKPNDEVEHTFGAAAAALVVGSGNGIVEIEGHSSNNVLFIADRFRKDGDSKIQDLSIASYKKYAYTNSISGAVDKLMTELGLKPDDFNHVFIQGHDTREPTRVIPKLFDKKKIYTDTLNVLGDTGAASVLIGLVGILNNVAKPNDRILCISYGSGAGSTAVSLVVKVKQAHDSEILNLEAYLNNKKYLDYSEYLKFKELIELE
ncbi:MAG: hydroxymethylglutaryl-CoA synthase [Candidatus Helarchaeota archaeon]